MVKLCLKLFGSDFDGTFNCFLCKQTCHSTKHLRHHCLLEALDFVTVPCLKGKKDILEFLLTEGICSGNDLNKVSYYQYQSMTPLIAACRVGHTDIVNLLIKNGALVNLKDKNGNTPLIVSCDRGYNEIVKVLVENGADLEERCCLGMFECHYILDIFDDELDDEGWSALWWASYRGHLSIVSYLLDKGANIHNTNKAGKTPLWAAIQSKNYDLVALLMRKGFSVNVQDKDGRTPIWWASNVGQLEMLYLFLDLGGNVNIYDNNDKSPLYSACYRNHFNVAELLINHGAKINANHPLQPSPLIGACCMKDTNLVSLLIRSGADVNYSFQGMCSPLSIATWSSFQSGITILIKNGAKINMKLNKGQTVLLQCILNPVDVVQKLPYILHDISTTDDLCFNFDPDTSENFPAVVSLLIKYGSDLNCQDENGLTALMGAVQLYRECTKILLEHGACVNLQDKNSRSALHYACFCQNHATISLLIEYGADIDAKDNSGYTPTHYACEKLDKKTLEILLNNGAEINLIDNMGFTPLLRCLCLEVRKSVCEDNIKDFILNVDDKKKQRSDCLLAIALKLLEHGADVRVSAFELDALSMAKILNDRKLVEALLEKVDKISATG